MRFSVRKPERLIDFLKNELSTAPSSKYLRRMLEANLCRVNGRIERFASARLETGDRVEIAHSWKTIAAPEPIRVIYEDEHLKVVEKPMNWVCSDEMASRTFGPRHFLVHRLDKDTTGLLLLAKSPEVKDRFIQLFEKKEVEKLYWALADALFPEERKVTRESFFIKKGSFEGQTIWGEGREGSYASTRFHLLARGQQASLISCTPITGRTHQIRVHLAALGHPLLIDRQYASLFRCSQFFQRPMLHAARLRFPHPVTGETIDLCSPLPADFQNALKLVHIPLSTLTDNFV